MRSFGRWLAWQGAGTVVAVVAVGAAGLVPAAAATGPVSATPAAGTPQLATTGTTEQIRQLVDCGGTMYAVGTFTSISGWNGTPPDLHPEQHLQLQRHRPLHGQHVGA